MCQTLGFVGRGGEAYGFPVCADSCAVCLVAMLYGGVGLAVEDEGAGGVVGKECIGAVEGDDCVGHGSPLVF